MSLFVEVLNRVAPDEDYRELIEGTVASLNRRILEVIEDLETPIDVQLVGSVAKDTYLVSPDIDIFLKFPLTTSRSKLESEGLFVGKRVLGGEERYADHPYVHGEFNGLEVDIVPCFDLSDPSNLKSAVDRTPFHTEYIMERLDEEQRDEVRLLKQFMKGVGVYGAESRIEGFSGYLVELLILRYGDFESVISTASGWRPGIRLSLKNEESSAFDDPLIFIDPVDPSRNVASALSLESFSFFIHSCREFLKEEGIHFFFPREREPLEWKPIEEMLQERGTKILMVRLNRPDLIDDNLYPQVKKTLLGVRDMLTRHDFVVLDSGHYVEDEVFLIYELESLYLPLSKKHHGPPVWIDHGERFLEKWNKEGLSLPFIEEGRWVVMAPREWTSAKQLIVENIDNSSLGSAFRDKEGLEVLEGEEISCTESHRKALSSLLDKRKPWEL